MKRGINPTLYERTHCGEPSCSHLLFLPAMPICTAIILAVCLLITLNAVPANDSPQRDAEWPAYGRDPGGSRYSPLKQINRDTVKNLKVAWSYRTGAADVKGRSVNNAAFEATPIFVDGTFDLCTPFHRWNALDPEVRNEGRSYGQKVELHHVYVQHTTRLV